MSVCTLCFVFTVSFIEVRKESKCCRLQPFVYFIYVVSYMMHIHFNLKIKKKKCFSHIRNMRNKQRSAKNAHMQNQNVFYQQFYANL